MDYKEKLIVLLNNTELSEEQKAKLEEIFPELCESENDRIKKFIENELIMIRACYDKGTERYENLTDAIEWLEKQVEQKPAWSEEDETVLGNLIWALENDMVLANDRDEYVGWLKSLKDRIQPQSYWKPSDEQINALEKECIAHSNYELCRLLEQLKKLREE